MLLQNIELERMLSATRIQPIPPADTALSAAPANEVAPFETATPYDRAAAGYVTSSQSTAVLDYVVCLEAASRRQPGDNFAAKLRVAAMFCASKTTDFPPGEPEHTRSSE